MWRCIGSSPSSLQMSEKRTQMHLCPFHTHDYIIGWSAFIGLSSVGAEELEHPQTFTCPSTNFTSKNYIIILNKANKTLVGRQNVKPTSQMMHDLKLQLLPVQDSQTRSYFYFLAASFQQLHPNISINFEGVWDSLRAAMLMTSLTILTVAAMSSDNKCEGKDLHSKHEHREEAPWPGYIFNKTPPGIY